MNAQHWPASRRLLRTLVASRIAARGLPLAMLPLWIAAHTAACASSSTPIATSSSKEHSTTSDWQRILSRPSDVRVTVLATGAAQGDRRVVLDPEDPKIVHLEAPMAPSDVLAYLVEHPTHGAVLIDAGLSESFSTGVGNYPPPLRKLLDQMNTKTSQSAGESARSQLKKRGLEPRAIYLTHLHADHTSGIADFPCTTPVFFGEGEVAEAQHAFFRDHLKCHNTSPLPWRSAPAIPPFAHALDIFGDGTLWALATPGHSPGHLSYLVHSASGPILITGDAVAYRDQFDHAIRPSPYVHDAELALRSLRTLVRFAANISEVRVLVGHEGPSGHNPPPHASALDY